jgi:DNA-binding NarL/FixJ family response regulator
MSAGPAQRIIRPMSRTVLIVDDHAEFRASARALLEADGFVVAGEAVDGAQAVAMAASLRPAIVLLDIALPDIDGFAVAVRLADTDEPPDVILVSSRERAVYGRRIDRAPVRGFVPKRALSGAAIGALLG